MATYTCNVQEPYNTYIRNNIKTRECRVNVNKWSTIKVGDILEIHGVAPVYTKVVTCRVEKPLFIDLLNYYNSRGELHQVMPNVATVQEACDIYATLYPIQQTNSVVSLELI